VSDQVLITLITCVTIVVALGMVRSTLVRLVDAKKDSFTFAVKFIGAGIWIFRGTHRPVPESLPERVQTDVVSETEAKE